MNRTLAGGSNFLDRDRRARRPQMRTNLAKSPSGDAWVMNDREEIDGCLGVPDEALSIRCGDQGVTILFDLAKPLRAPRIELARAH